MSRPRSRGAPAPTQAVLDPLSAVDSAHLDIADALRRVVGYLADGRVQLFVVFNPAESRRDHRRREDRTTLVLGLLRRICREGKTLRAEQAEALLLRAGQVAIDIDPATPQDARAAEYVIRMLKGDGLYEAIRVQKVPKGKKRTDHFPDVPLACLGTLEDLGSAPAAAPTELPDSSAPLGRRSSLQPVTV